MLYHNALVPVKEHLSNGKGTWVGIPPMPHVLGNRNGKHYMPKVQQAFYSIPQYIVYAEISFPCKTCSENAASGAFVVDKLSKPTYIISEEIRFLSEAKLISMLLNK